MDWRLVRHLLQGRLVVRSRPLPGRSTWPPRRLTGEPARWWQLILHPPQISQRPARVSTPLSPEVSGRCLSATCDRHSCEPQDAVAVRIRASALELVWLPMPGNEMGPPLAGVGYIYSRRRGGIVGLSWAAIRWCGGRCVGHDRPTGSAIPMRLRAGPLGQLVRHQFWRVRARRRSPECRNPAPCSNAAITEFV